MTATGYALVASLLAAVTAVAAGSPSTPEEPGSSPMEAEPLHLVPDPPTQDPRVIALGQALFRDKRLSANDTMSCLSCVVPELPRHRDQRCDVPPA